MGHHQCNFCNGTGADSSEWDGECAECDGSGWVPDDTDDVDGDDEAEQ